MGRLIFTILLIVCSHLFSLAQDRNPISEILQLITSAEKQNSKEQYDSALYYLQKADALVLKKKLQQEPTVAILYNLFGNTWLNKLNYIKAHDFFTKALHTSYITHNKQEAVLAFTSLNTLHKEISQKDIEFPYPIVSEKEQASIAFPILAINNINDSTEITIAAGRYDGVTDSLQKIEIYTRYIQGDTTHHNQFNYITTGKIISLSNNYTVLRVEKTTIPILKNDIAYVKALIPAAWRNLSMRHQLLNGVYLVDNYKQDIYSYRYFYYYGDSLAEKQSLANMEYAIQEVLDLMGADTVTNSQFGKRITAGIFSGYNIMSGMLNSKPSHIKLFLNFIKAYYTKYINNNFRFSETYATWMINNTPLVDADVKQYLFGWINNDEKFIQEIIKLQDQINESNLAERWLDEGMQAVAIENTEQAHNTALLLKAFYSLQNDNKNIGWANYLLANVEKKLNNDQIADSLLKLAQVQFEKADNKEGLIWEEATKKNWKKGHQVNVGIQNGNLFGFEIAQSYDPRFFATGGADNMIKIWDRNLGKEIITLNDHTDEINSLEYSSNGRYLGSVGNDKIINIYNAYNYSLTYQLKTVEAERKIRFSADNNLIAVCGADSVIKLIDFKKDSIIQKLKKHKDRVRDIAWDPNVKYWLYSAGQDSMVYRWDIRTGEMLRWYRLKGKVLSVKINPEGRYMSTISTDSMLTVWDLETNKKWMTTRIHVFQQGNNRHYASETFSADNKYICYPFAKDSFNIVRLRDYKQATYPTEVMFNNLADVQFSKDGRTLYARFSLGSQIRLYNFTNWDIENNTVINYKDIRSFSNFLVGVEFSKDDNNLIITHSGISKVDLRNGKTQHLPSAHLSVPIRKVFFNDEKRFITFCEYEPCFRIEDLSGNVVGGYSLPKDEAINAFDMSKDNLYAFAAGKKGNIYGWNLTTGNKLFGKIYFPESNISHIAFDNYRKQIIIVEDSSVSIIDSTGTIVKNIRTPEATYAVSSDKYLYISTTTGYLLQYDYNGNKLVNKTQLNKEGNPVYQVLLSKKEGRLYVQSSNNYLVALDAETLKLLYTVFDHDYGGAMLTLNNSEEILASTGFDSKLKLYKAVTGEHIADIYMPLEREAIIINRDGYYLSQKNSLDALLFSYNNNSYTYEQFDAQFNRPDLVLKKLGRADSATLGIYKAAFKKRLSRLNIQEQSPESVLEVPFVRILDKSNVETITSKKEFILNIQCRDNRFPINTLQVLVNNTPIKSKGFSFANTTSLLVEKQIVIPLSRGENNIKVFCTNSKGARSLSEQIQVFAKYEQQAPTKTFFIGIAVDQYKDSSMNLRYSAKDIRDLTNTFNNLYDNIEIDTFINEKATKENILSIRKKLLNTNVNDRVILAITGHGLLSKIFDFYYATWDNIFSAPEKRGIKYDELENLLSDIPARRKLMLIDACHSGALDKEALVKQNVSIQTDSIGTINGVSPRGVIKLSGNKDIAAANTFDMMQRLFTDLDGNNGAVIISAAGGMEYALESAKWNNGVFTYCVRKGIEEKAADRETGNYDGQVSVQELQQYVSRKVSELTGGKQQPTNRRENLDFEWFLRR